MLSHYVCTSVRRCSAGYTHGEVDKWRAEISAASSLTVTATSVDSSPFASSATATATTADLPQTLKPISNQDQRAEEQQLKAMWF